MPTLTPRTDWDPRFLDALPRHFAPLAARAAPLRAFDAWPAITDWNALLPASPPLVNARGRALRFEAQDVKRNPERVGGLRAREDLYEARVYLHGVIPSRPRCWHDLFNMLVWSSFPRSKRALNARQYRCLEAWVPARFARLPNARTREQDALSMLDEGSVLLLCHAPHGAAVRGAIARGDHDALHAFAREGRLAALTFGHALYEHFVSSDAPVRAAPVVLATEAPVPDGDDLRRDLADALFARALDDARRFTEPSSDPAVPLVRALL